MNVVAATRRLLPFFEANTEVIERNMVKVEAFTVRSVYPNMLRRKVQHLPKACFLFADFVFRPLAIRNVLDRTEHLPGTARRVSLQIALTMHDANFALGANDPMLCVCAPLASRGFGTFPKHEFSIFGVDRFPNCRQFNGTFLRVQSVDPVGLI